jgi:hypothetical protein
VARETRRGLLWRLGWCSLVVALVACGGPAPQAGNWKVLASVRGAGLVEFVPFQITSPQWRIRWSAESPPGTGLLQASIRSADGGRLVRLVVNQQGPGSDVAYVRTDPGLYLIYVNAADVVWSLVVEEPRP